MVRRLGFAVLLFAAACSDISLEGAKCLSDGTCGNSGLFCVREGDVSVCRAQAGPPLDSGTPDAGVDAGVDAGSTPLLPCDGGFSECALTLSSGHFPTEPRWAGARLAAGRFTGDGTMQLAVLSGTDDSLELLSHVDGGTYARLWAQDGGFSGTGTRMLVRVPGANDDGLLVLRRSRELSVYRPDFVLVEKLSNVIWASSTGLPDGGDKSLALTPPGVANNLHVYVGLTTGAPAQVQVTVPDFLRAQAWGDLTVVDDGGTVSVRLPSGDLDAGARIVSPLDSPVEVRRPPFGDTAVVFQNAAGTQLLQPGPQVSTLTSPDGGPLTVQTPLTLLASAGPSGSPGRLVLLVPAVSAPAVFQLAGCANATCPLVPVTWPFASRAFTDGVIADLNGDGAQDIALIDDQGILFIFTLP